MAKIWPFLTEILPFLPKNAHSGLFIPNATINFHIFRHRNQIFGLPIEKTPCWFREDSEMTKIGPFLKISILAYLSETLLNLWSSFGKHNVGAWKILKWPKFVPFRLINIRFVQVTHCLWCHAHGRILISMHIQNNMFLLIYLYFKLCFHC